MRIFWSKKNWPLLEGWSACRSLEQGQVFFLKFSEMYLDIFLRFCMMKIAKMIQKLQSVPHENYLAWLGIRIATRAAKSQQRIDGKWEDS